MVTKKRNGGALTPAGEPTTREKAAIQAHLKRRQERIPARRVKIVRSDGEIALVPDHPDHALGNSLLMEALATAEIDFLDGLLVQLANVSSKGQKPDERGLNFMLAIIKGIEPRDQLETLLAAQMAAVHNATMTFARRLNHVDNLPQQDSAERAFNKLARTFAAQVEALKKYRSKGEQRVTVEHVTVNQGGQAIVGNIAQPGGGSRDKDRGSTPCT